MQIALYSNHHHLPFWHEPKQPTQLFNPDVHGEWIMEEGWKLAGRPFKENLFWPILQGIAAIDLRIMAHVSLNLARGKLLDCKRVWVMFTSIPNKTTADGIPLVVSETRADEDDDGVQVHGLWADNGDAYSPFDLDGAPKEDSVDAANPSFWSEFFMCLLRDKKKEEIASSEIAIREAQATLLAWQQVPDIWQRVP